MTNPPDAFYFAARVQFENTRAAYMLTVLRHRDAPTFNAIRAYYGDAPPSDLLRLATHGKTPRRDKTALCALIVDYIKTLPIL